MPLRARQLYRFGPYRLDVNDRMLYRDGHLVALPPKVFDTLLLLVANRGQVLGKDEMIKHLWPDTFVEEGTLAQYVFLLRKALGDSASWIENHPRRGYRFTAPVEMSEDGVAELKSAEQTWRQTVIEEQVVPQQRRSIRLQVLATILAVVTAVIVVAVVRKNGQGQAPGSVAVLPFRTVPDSADRYLADGITEALIARLAKLDSLRVVPYSRVRQFKGSSAKSSDIGRQLGVDAVIEGTVQVGSGQMRLAAQVIDTKTSGTIWADNRFEAATARMLQIEGQLAEAVAHRLRGGLTSNERTLVARSGTRNPEAYDLFLRARALLKTTPGPEAWESSVEMLERAVRLDPGFAEAYGWLAFAQTRMNRSSLMGRNALRKAIANANQALSRDPNSSIAIRALTHIQHSTGRVVEGLLMARRALENDPDDVDATAAAAEAYFRAGLGDRAIPLYEKALAAEPDNRHFRTQLARIYFFLGEYSKGVEAISVRPPSEVGAFGMLLYAEAGEMGKAVHAASSPNDDMGGFGRYVRGSVLADAGDLAGAREIWTEATRVGEALLAENEHSGDRYCLGLSYARLRRRDLALHHLRQMLAPDPRHPRQLFFAAEVHALLGNRSEALHSLKLAVENGFFNLPMIEAMARSRICTLYSLRNDPEFLAIRADLARRVDELRSLY